MLPQKELLPAKVMAVPGLEHEGKENAVAGNSVGAAQWALDITVGSGVLRERGVHGFPPRAVRRWSSRIMHTACQ